MGPAPTEGPTQMPTEVPFEFVFIYSKRIESRDVGERAHDEGISPCTFIKRAKRAAVPFYENVMGNFMVY